MLGARGHGVSSSGEQTLKLCLEILEEAGYGVDRLRHVLQVMCNVIYTSLVDVRLDLLSRASKKCLRARCKVLLGSGFYLCSLKVFRVVVVH